MPHGTSDLKHTVCGKDHGGKIERDTGTDQVTLLNELQYYQQMQNLRQLQQLQNQIQQQMQLQHHHIQQHEQLQQQHQQLKLQQQQQELQLQEQQKQQQQFQQQQPLMIMSVQHQTLMGDTPALSKNYNERGSVDSSDTYASCQTHPFYSEVCIISRT